MGNLYYADLGELCESGNAKGIEEVLTTWMGFRKERRKNSPLKRQRPSKEIVEYLLMGKEGDFMGKEGTYSFIVPQDESTLFERLYHDYRATRTNNPEIPFMVGFAAGIMIGAKSAEIFGIDYTIPMLAAMPVFGYVFYKLFSYVKSSIHEHFASQLKREFSPYVRVGKPFDHKFISNFVTAP